jgi:Mor family transcriptional regulator
MSEVSEITKVVDIPSLMKFPENYPEQLEHIGQILYRELLRMDLTPEVANTRAFSMVEALRHGVGGGALYIPRGLNYELSLRDMEIWGKFKGDNIAELATKYELSQMQVRNILSVARARETAKRQANLFE